jgi:hypothetical protein
MTTGCKITDDMTLGQAIRRLEAIVDLLLERVEELESRISEAYYHGWREGAYDD